MAPPYCRRRPAIVRKRWKRVFDDRKRATSGQETVDWRMEYKVICVFVSTFKLLSLKKYVIHPLIFIIPYQLGAQFELTRRRRQGESTPSTHDSFGVLIGGQGDLFSYPTSKFFETKLYATHSSFVTNIGQRGQRPREARGFERGEGSARARRGAVGRPSQPPLPTIASAR